MAQRSDAKVENIHNRECPHPFCSALVWGRESDLMMHYRDKHKCGRCNAGKHHKCKKNLCGCGCRWGDATQDTYDTTTLGKLLEMASKRLKLT